MILTIITACGVLVLAASSAYLNYLHLEHLGAAMVLLVIGGEIFKFVALPAMAIHAQQWRIAPFLTTGLLWLIVVAFSFSNTFGNSLMRAAKEQARLERMQESHTRPVVSILKDIAAIPPCKKKSGTPCADARAEKLEPLRAELELAKQRANKGDEYAIESGIKGDPIRDGLVQLAAMFGYSVPKDKVFIYVTLAWTLLAEFGSAFGGLVIPLRGKP